MPDAIRVTTRRHVTDFCAEVGRGWRPLLEALHNELARDGDYETVTVEAPDGLLHVTLRDPTIRKLDYLRQYRSISGSYCERCGVYEGRTRVLHGADGQRKTLCYACVDVFEYNRAEFWRTFRSAV